MKRIMFVSAVLMITTVSLAQDKQLPAFSFQAGLNIANINETDGSASKTYNSLAKFNAGINYEIILSPKWALETGLWYDGKGATIKEGGVTAKMNLNYLTIPLMAKFYLGSGFDIQAGFTPGILLNANVKNKDNDIKVKMTEYYNTLDFGFAAGLNYTIPNSHFTLFILGDAGIVNVVNKDKMGSAAGMQMTTDVQTMTWTFGAKYNLRYRFTNAKFNNPASNNSSRLSL